MAEATLVAPDTTETEPAAEATTEVATEDREAEGTTTETETGAKAELTTNPETEALEARLREQWDQEQRDRDEAQQEEKKRTERATKTREDLRELHSTAKTELRTQLGVIQVTGLDGETFPVTLGEPALKHIDSAFDKVALKARISVDHSIREEIIDAVTASLPAAEREATSKSLASVLEMDDKGQLVMPIPEVVKAIRTALVPDPKKMTADDLPPHLKTEFTKLKKELWDAQHPKPAGESAGEGRQADSGGPANKKEADAIYAASPKTRQDLNNLRAARARFAS